MSWKYEVVADRSGKWFGNELRFATIEEAKGAGDAKFAAWTLVTELRVVESADPVNYCWINGHIESL